MRTTIIMLLGLGLFGQAGADPLLEGHVRLPSGAPVAGAQVLLFDLADLRAAPRAATTDRSGRFTLPPATGAGALPQGFELGANYPNPFNPSTMIPYRLPASMHVRLEVFNLLGQRIATLVDGEQPAGFHTASWDATDAAGQAVAAGVYLYRLSGDGMRATRSMLLIDGQAGIPSGGGASSTGGHGEAGGDGEKKAPVYGLTVSGPGLVPYVDPAFRVEGAMGPLDLVVEAPGRVPLAKAASSDRILGDVDNTGGVDFFDALLVALYSQDASLVLPNDGDITLGDVNADGRVDLTDAWLIAVWLDDPADPSLPAGIGEPVGPATLTLGESLEGGLEEGGEVDYFRVEVSEPGLLLVYTTGSSHIKGTLEDSTGTALATNDDGGRSDNFRITHFVDAGTYYVKVEGDRSWSTGSYTIHASIHGSTRDQAPSLTLGESLEGELEIGGEVDYFRVEVSEPGLLLVYTTGSSNIKGTLEDNTGTALATDDDGGRSDNFRITHFVDAGTYYVKVEGDRSWSTGSYTIHASIHGSTRDQAPSLTLGESLEGELEIGGEVDYFRVEVSEPGLLLVYTTGSSNIKGTLEDNTGTALATDDDGGRSDNFRITHFVDAGTYYVKVEGDYSWNTGSYTIHASIHGSTRDQAPSLTLGESLEGELEIGGEVDYFRVEVSEPGLLLVYTTGSSNIKGTLEDSTGDSLATDDDSGSGDNFKIAHGVSAGTYYVKVEGDRSWSTGSYTIHASIHGSTRDQAPSLTLGESLEGELEIGGEVDYFRVEVSEPGLLLVYTTGSSNIKGTLEDSTGDSLATDDDSGSGDNFKIAHGVSAGTYYVKVEGDRSWSTGSYTIFASFNSDHGNTRATASLLSLDSLLYGQIEPAGDVDYFQIEVSESKVLTVYTTGSLDTKGTLEDSTGDSLATDDDGGSGDNFRIAHSVSAGTYYVKVEGDSSSSSGTGIYTIHASVSSRRTRTAPRCYEGMTLFFGQSCRTSYGGLLFCHYLEGCIVTRE